MEFELIHSKKYIFVCLTFIYLANELKGLSLGLGYKSEFGLHCHLYPSASLKLEREFGLDCNFYYFGSVTGASFPPLWA